MLGPLLFNIFINDMFYSDLECKTCNFVDDRETYVELRGKAAKNFLGAHPFRIKETPFSNRHYKSVL